MATRRLDTEMLLDRITQVLQGNLNNKISSINSEINDSISLSSIPSNDAFFVESLDGATANFDPYVAIYIEEMQSEGIGPRTSETAYIDAVIVVSDHGGDINIWRKMHRYQRALKEVIQENWSQIIGVSFSISSLQPVRFQELNSSKLYRAVGVQLKVTIV